MQPENHEARIGLVSISDRASQGVYEDEGLPALKNWLSKALSSPWQPVERLIPTNARVLPAKPLKFLFPWPVLSA